MKKTLWKASQVYAPTFPRRSTGADQMQGTRRSRGGFCAALDSAMGVGEPGYYSVYSFPRGHPKNDHIPEIDCIFIDLDIVNEHYQPDPEKPGYDASFESWRADMSSLLARARMIAQAIIEADKADAFRVALSGHKGIHFYLDFPPISPTNGSIGQFKAGLAKYGNDVMELLDELAGGVNIEPWVDVDGSDLARLARHPNTIHHGAAYDNETRWCVPVTVEELADLHCDDYLEYSSGPRWPEIERCPSESVHDMVVQMIRTASVSGRSSGSGAAKQATKETALEDYRGSEHVNDDMTLEDVLFFVQNKPCFKAFRQRGDAYQYGEESRTMELSIMGRLLDMGVPLDVIHEFFETIPGYDRQITNDILADLLARGNEYGEFNCSTVCDRASRFCLGENCNVYLRNDDLQA